MRSINKNRITVDVDESVHARFDQETAGLTEDEAVERAMLLWAELKNPEEMVEDVVR